MSTSIITEQIRWQDLKIRGEIDIVFEIAKKEGWKDCEVFGYGDMITEPQEITGWKLIPADLYTHSIPPEAIARLHQIINAGIRVQGVIIADDQRKDASAATPVPVPVEPRFLLPSVQTVLPQIGKAANRIIHSAGTVASSFGHALLGFFGAAASFVGKALLVLICVAAAISFAGFAFYVLSHYLWMTIPLGILILIGAGSSASPGRSIAALNVVVTGWSLGLLTDTCQRSGFWPTFVTWMNNSRPATSAMIGWPATMCVTAANSGYSGT